MDPSNPDQLVFLGRRYQARIDAEHWGILDTQTGADHPRPAWSKADIVSAVKWLNAYERRIAS